MTHYFLPDNKVLISFSGGRTSGFMLNKILKANGGLPETCKVVFANTGREMPETLDFVQECSDRWNVKITWLEYQRTNNKVGFDIVSHNSASRDGEPFEALLYQPYLPNIMRRFCTQQLKVLTIKRYLKTLGWTRWINTVGIRADEAHRVKPSTDKRWTNWFPLADAGATVKNVMSFWKSQPFDLRVKKGGGNCDGCFLKSEATLAAMWREHPDRMQWWADQESKFGSTFNKTRSYKGLGDFVERQSDWIFNDEAYLCQKNEGECTT
tara:strand:+ start:54 stop:854 length:801 start_codon:yes stop_codon:yes gene_type:complete